MLADQAAQPLALRLEVRLTWAVIRCCKLIVAAAALAACAPPGAEREDAGIADAGLGDAGDNDAGTKDGGAPGDAGPPDGGADPCARLDGLHVSLQGNRDRLLADLARRKETDSCTLWAALNQAERYVFLMDTTYLAASSSRLSPPAANLPDTALDHAIALYSINGPKAGEGVDHSGRGGIDYNRIYLGFDAPATCLIRSFARTNPTKAPGFNQWLQSDDPAGPHAPFKRREMIFWYRAIYDLSSNGPQFHHWATDAEVDGAGIDKRLGVCGVRDASLTELTIAFDFFHNSDPLGQYAGRGGQGWQIVDQRAGLAAEWGYLPTGCRATPPVNTDPYGGGTFAGMGPSLDGGTCGSTTLH